VLTRTERALTPREREHLGARLLHARRESRTMLTKTAISSILVCGVLALLTLVASTAPRWSILLFWAGATTVFTLWIGIPWQRDARQQVDWLDDALRTDRVRAIRIVSPRVIEFEEEEDEGACYAFEHGPESSVFVVGQEFYEDDDFPNSDFSLIELLGSHGGPVDVLLEKTGRKLSPERVIPAKAKNMMEIPEHLTVITAPLDVLEHALTHAR
jgi:hypothetical protein